ncbi:MAG: dihydrodipicolinate reductase C-terminal domain-containing protein [Xanthomonadales bacterium]|jgi:4-hydroxy-tetrahydrodipicolinate reductase
MPQSEAQPLLISGLPGRMAAEVAHLAHEAPDMALHSVGLTSDARHASRFTVDTHEIRLIAPDREPVDLPPGTIAVDYSTPDAALSNARWLVARGIPFVMGTTGFDAAELKAAISESSVAAVAAPNMAAPIVLLQAALRWLADEFPGSCRETTLSVRESHQKGKRDTSGTARALVDSFRRLGIDCNESLIESIRDPERQRGQLRVPEAYLHAHAFHRYELGAAGDTVGLALEHNVLGRRVYAEGTLQAIRFLRGQIARGAAGRLFSMEDVLRGSAALPGTG